MRVMVTGATTPLGGAIVDAILATEPRAFVLAIAREPLGRHDPRVLACDVDLRRRRSVIELLAGPARDHGIAIVVHAAQHRDPRQTGGAVHAQNVEATRELVRGCADHPTIRRFVYRSFAEVYAPVHASAALLTEEAPLDFDPEISQWTRDRVEADLLVCAQHSPRLDVLTLRCAELFAPASGSALWAYLARRICLRPAGHDPMINALSLADAARAFLAAISAPVTGVFNIRGAETLPLSVAIAAAHRMSLPIPGLPLSRRYRFGGLLEGTRALKELHYEPREPVRWRA